MRSHQPRFGTLKDEDAGLSLQVSEAYRSAEESTRVPREEPQWKK
jgi:hypothetical protein